MSTGQFSCQTKSKGAKTRPINPPPPTAAACTQQAKHQTMTHTATEHPARHGRQRRARNPENLRSERGAQREGSRVGGGWWGELPRQTGGRGGRGGQPPPKQPPKGTKQTTKGRTATKGREGAGMEARRGQTHAPFVGLEAKPDSPARLRGPPENYTPQPDPPQAQNQNPTSTAGAALVARFALSLQVFRPTGGGALR